MYVNPYQNALIGVDHGLKANFHTHAGTGKGTCGHHEIDDVLEAYEDAGYQVLTISNHDLLTDMNQYGEEYDIVLINGYEYSMEPHMLCIGCDELCTGTHQEAIDSCVEQGGFVILCHPNWIRKEYWPWKDIDNIRGFTGLEIYNHLIYRLEGSGLAVDTWDYILSKGRLAWGFGNDDFHRWQDLGRVWNIILSPSHSKSDIISSIKSGSFYVSTGLLLSEFEFENNILKVSACFRNTYIKEYKYRFIGQDGRVLDTQTGESGVYKLNGNEKYVRVEAIGENGAMLWTQPVYNPDCFEKP